MTPDATGVDAGASWSTQQLTQLLVAVSGLRDAGAVVQQVAEQATEALESEVGAVVLDGRVRCCLGFGRRSVPGGLLVGLRTGDLLDVPGAGACAVLVGELADLPGARLVVARSGGGWTQEERGLLRAMARVLALSLQTLTSVAELHERQALLERLARIQRSISSRKPLQEVLDTIVAGAADLLDEDIVALRLLDPDDDGVMETVSSIGIPARLVQASRRMPVTEGVGGQAIREDRLVVATAYGGAGHHIQPFVVDGISAAMAAPVRQGDRPVGSLTLATRRTGRVYSVSEQEALLAFAEHAGLALQDARTVQALHRAVDEATHQALHDSLTGLPNRALFLDRLSHALARRRRGSSAGFAVLFIDLDDFKMVNDGLGHLVGDRLLAEAGERICRAVRAPDTVARLGGDEFAVLLEDVDTAAAATTAERVRLALSQPFPVADGHAVHVGASVGLLAGTAGEGSAEELLRDADVAMYHAKDEGKGRVVVFEPRMRQRLQARTELEQELRTAVVSEQMVVHYQPVVDLARRRVTGVEALLRWQHPLRGLVPPSEFVPLAEDTGLIVPLGSAVLRTACAAAAAWPGAPLVLSVNLSPRQLREPDVVDVVRAALSETGLPAERLVLEITESLLVREVEGSTCRLEALKALGVRLAVDDFGTGYSSLSYLSRLPVDTLKVDRAFVAGLLEGGSQGRLAGAVIALAQSLDLSTVAEGVEHEAQAVALQAQGASVVQGFAYSPPVPLGDLGGVIATIERRLAGEPALPHARRPADSAVVV